MNQKCEKDCWECQLDGCPYTLKASEELENDIRFEDLRIRHANDNRHLRYRATPKGRKNLIQAKNRYEKKNPEKVALWQFKSRYKRKYGESPGEDICNTWLKERISEKENCILYGSNA